MPTTTTWQIYFPDGSTLWNPATIFSTAATSVDVAMSLAQKLYGNPYYASSSVRDLAYAPASGMPALANGMCCSVAGVPQIYIVGRGWVYQGNVLPMLAVARTTTFAVSTSSTWTIIAMDASLAATDNNGGSGLTAVTNGIQVTNAGSYRVDANIEWASSIVGGRFLSIGTSATDTHHDKDRILTQVSTGAPTDPMHFSDEITVAAAAVISVLGYQSTGAALNVSQAGLRVRQVA